VNVARTLVAHVGAVPEVLHDLLAAEDPLGIARQEVEEPELGRSQRDHVAVDAHLVPSRVELEPADAFDRASAFAVELPAAQDRADAPDQLGHRERLRDVVVRADLQPDDTVHLRSFRGEHHDGYGALGPQAAADLRPREARKHQVEDHDVEAVLEGCLQTGLAVLPHLDIEAFLTKRVADRVPERRLVVDDEDSRHGFTRLAPIGSFMLTVVP
jgi:hypothetical protein